MSDRKTTLCAGCGIVVEGKGAERCGMCRQERVRERERERNRKRRQDPAFLEMVRTRAREYARMRRQDPEIAQRGREYQRERMKEPENRRRGRESRLKAKFGLSPDEVEVMRAAQNGRCGCCGKLPTPATDGREALKIDHRHDNGAIRGMLCNRCNTLLGALDLRYTDPELWRALLAWSDKEAPAVPVRSRAQRGRKVRNPTLFDQAEH